MDRMEGTVRTTGTTKTNQVVDEDDGREKKRDHSAEMALEVPDAKLETSPRPTNSRVKIQTAIGPKWKLIKAQQKA